MSKSESLPPVRVDPELKAALRRISDVTGVSLYELTRRAVSEYVARQLRVDTMADRLMTVADGEAISV